MHIERLKCVKMDVSNNLNNLSLNCIFNLLRICSGGFNTYTEGSVQSDDV